MKKQYLLFILSLITIFSSVANTSSNYSETATLMVNNFFTIYPDINNILYVNKNVSGGVGDGRSWQDAITELSDSLPWVSTDWDTNDGTLQIRGAKGRYTLTIDNTDQMATFQLINGVEVVEVLKEVSRQATTPLYVILQKIPLFKTFEGIFGSSKLSLLGYNNSITFENISNTENKI